MTNTLTKTITVININELLKGNIFTAKNIYADYPTERISYGFGDFSYSSDYKHAYKKRTPEEIAKMDAKFDKMELPF